MLSASDQDEQYQLMIKKQTKEKHCLHIHAGDLFNRSLLTLTNRKKCLLKKYLIFFVCGLVLQIHVILKYTVYLNIKKFKTLAQEASRFRQHRPMIHMTFSD